MPSVAEMLEAARKKARGPRQRKKNISGHGHGKWETRASLAAYRRRRNKARKVAHASRRSQW